MNRWLGAILGLVYPLTCCTCGSRLTEDKGMCDKCTSTIQKRDYGIAACQYDGPLKDALHKFKYKGELSLLNTFSPILQDFIDNNINMDDIDAIVPIPLHPVRLRERGYNQSYLLSAPIAKRYNKPILDNALIKSRHTPSQSGLDRQKRVKNIKGSFKIRDRDSIKGKNILIVDDVYTTGTTIDEAQDVLKRSDAHVVKRVTLATGT